MSVKLMSAEAIRNDLRTIDLTWPDGVPAQQVDRVNALKAELKRRGEPLDGPASPTMARAMNSITALSTEELEAELRTLSTRNDEASQTRFADVRYELRRRASNGAEPAPPPRPQAAIRELELPADDEIVAPPIGTGKPADRIVPRRPTLPAPRPAMPQVKKAPTTVCGYTATDREDGSVVLEYEKVLPNGSVVIAGVLEGEEADDFISMVMAARARARARAVASA